MASDFPAFLAYGEPWTPIVQEMPILSTDTSVAGELVYYDTADDTVKECGADPSLILGIILGPGPASTRLQKPLPYATQTTQPVAILTPNIVVGLCSATTPAKTQTFRADGSTYGIAKLSSGNWSVDTTDTSNRRVTVLRVDIANGVF